MLERKREYVTNTSGSAAEWRFHMTELGMLVWSKTGKMAKVVDTEKTYRVMMCSDGGTRRVMYSGLTEERAYDICRDYGWQVDLGYIWRLEIEEE